MKLFLKKIVLLLIFAMPFIAVAQDGGGDKPASAKSADKKPLSRRAQRSEDRKKWKEYRKKRKIERKAVKEHHKRIQTKETRKRMKKDRKKAQANNEHKREFFLKRWFKKK